MKELICQLESKFPDLAFKSGQRFAWSPETGEIFYKSRARGEQAMWSLLHETGHAKLGHTTYRADYELLRLEVAAWEEAKNLAQELNIVIDENHIQDCLDTYRDWLYKRSICPNCSAKSLQQNDYSRYRCFNCHTTWRVTASRFCRAYRTTKNIEQPKPNLHIKAPALTSEGLKEA